MTDHTRDVPPHQHGGTDAPECTTCRPAVRLCSTKTPEPHLAGEFPMSCYACHVEADS
jgi:hypothetical protein